MRGALALHCGDLAVAEELAQEALARAWDRWSQVRQKGSPGAWVYRVGINLASSRFRRLQAERRAYSRHGLARSGDEADEATASAIRTAVAALPRAQRSVLVLRFFLDLSVRETADVLGLSEGAVKQHTHRAIGVLRRLFLEDQTRGGVGHG